MRQNTFSGLVVYFLMITSILLVSFSCTSNQQNSFEGTEWQVETAPNCWYKLTFTSDSELVDYNYEMDQLHSGRYRRRNYTLEIILDTFMHKTGEKEMINPMKYIYLISGNKLTHVIRYDTYVHNEVYGLKTTMENGLVYEKK